MLLGCGKIRPREKIIIKQSPLQSPKSAASLSGNQTTAQRHPNAAATSVSYIKIYFSLLQVRALGVEGQRNRKLSSKDLPLDFLPSVLGIACRALRNRRAISKSSVGFSTSSLQTNPVCLKPKGWGWYLDKIKWWKWLNTKQTVMNSEGETLDILQRIYILPLVGLFF